jgi:EAL domain-containing protein (putative c-di-GMP-specific phosphodiesterase class I)
VLRWRRLDGTADSFFDLLRVAENTGLSITLGRETFDTVCRQLRIWSEELPQEELIVSINLTHRQFYHPDMVLQLKRALDANAVDPSRLLLEVAETTLNENPDTAVAILQRMVDCNVRIAVGNFGSSFAPLSHLVRMPIDVVKLAPQLTMAAVSVGRQQAVLESLIHLGHTLGMQVVAQGIETAAQLDGLCRMGCELGQGPLLSYALDPARATELMVQGTGQSHPVPEPGPSV